MLKSDFAQANAYDAESARRAEAGSITGDEKSNLPYGIPFPVSQAQLLVYLLRMRLRPSPRFPPGTAVEDP